tara:strand:- start:22 stop:306 length:285 start_codon:yes stop_codon:yes gene_type:complete
MQIANNNVSAFQYEEEKKESQTIDASSLRIPAEHSISDSSDPDLSQPIMHLMQIHQQLSGGKPNPKDFEDPSAISDEFGSNFRYQEESRGRQGM